MARPKRDADDMAGELIPFPGASQSPAGDELAPEDGWAGDTGEQVAESSAAATVASPVQDDVEHVGPVLDAEIVDDVEVHTERWKRRMDARPVFPAWVADGGQRTEAARWAVRYAWHVSRFHAVRAPVYGFRLVAASPRGAGRAVAAWYRWAADTEAKPLRKDTATRLDADSYIKLAHIGRDRVRTRLTVSLVVLAIIALGILILALAAPAWALWLLATGATAGLGVLGRRADKPIVMPATMTAQATRLTPDVVMRAFLAAGLAKEADPVSFAQPIQRDGKGWLAIVDLPFGKTFTQAASKREQIASGLNVNAVTVFLDPDPVSARRVRLWVSDIDVFAQKPVVSPLVKAESFDFWQPIPFGLDARDRLVTMPLVFSSLLVGAIPRMGKTFAARLCATAAALDPHVRLLVFNGKGDAAWRPFDQVAHVYGSGIREEVVELLVATLRDLVSDMNARFERMAQLPTDACPDAKLTPALARNRRLNMPLTVLAMDEVQRYLEHPEYGKEILELLTDLAKVGPAAGIMQVLATQKPDSRVIPDSLRGQIGTRFAMRVMTWQASETILGAGTYPAGLDASRFLSRHKGVGILLGADDGDLAERGGQSVRTHLLNGPALDVICTRGRALREGAGTLTGMAIGEIPVTESRPSRVLDDLAAVFLPGEDKAWSEVLVARLAERAPDAYDGWTANQLAVALKPYAVTPSQVWGTGEDGKQANRRGYTRDAVTDALAARLSP